MREYQNPSTKGLISFTVPIAAQAVAVLGVVLALASAATVAADRAWGLL